MQYQGGKYMGGNHIAKILTEHRKPGQWYIEPFCGGCGVLGRMAFPRLGADVNPYLVAYLQKISSTDWMPSVDVSREIFNDMKTNPENYDPAWVGIVGCALSFSGKWFGSYTGHIKKYQEIKRGSRKGEIRKYDEKKKMLKSAERDKKLLKYSAFVLKDYRTLDAEGYIPPESLIYCDPPYKGTAGYPFGGDFDHDAFWQWCINMVYKGHTVFVSEYSCPHDFEVVWERKRSSSLSNNKEYNAMKTRPTEKLFKIS